MRMVRLQIGQEKVKESVEVERQKLQEIADEVSTAACLACHSACKPVDRYGYHNEPRNV